jgi:hypothetical protein
VLIEHRTSHFPVARNARPVSGAAAVKSDFLACVTRILLALHWH